MAAISHRHRLFLILGFCVLVCRSPAYAQQRIEHLLQAASHLQQAGLPEMAAKVRELAAKELDRDKERLLDKKLAELQQLEGEIAQLRQIVGTLPQVMIRTEIYRLDQEKMQGGLGLVSFQSLLDEDEVTSIIDEDGTLSQFIDFLKRQRMLKVLAEPSLLTFAGRKATVVVDGAAPSSVERTEHKDADFKGMRLECTPTIGDNGKIQIELELHVNDRLAKAPSNGATSPTAISIKTKLKVVPGQTVLISSPGKKTGEGIPSGVLVVLRAELVDSADGVGSSADDGEPGLSRARCGEPRS